MIDLWLAFGITIGISMIAILAEWVVARLIIGARIIRTIENIVTGGLSRKDANQLLMRETQLYQTVGTASIIWGVDLAYAAIALDIGALGLWCRNQDLFSFFTLLNRPNESREVYLWLGVIVIHLILFFISLIMKRIHAESISRSIVSPSPAVGEQNWFNKNRMLLAANAAGFFALLTGIIIYSNAI